MSKLTGAQVLALPMRANDAHANTVRAYLAALARVLWQEGEGISGKRAFGNSGWESDLYEPLVTAGAITGTMDADGFLEEYDADAGDELIHLALDELANGPTVAQ